MLGSTVYEAILDSLRKDFRGNTLSPDEFNRLAPIINRRLLADYAKQFEDDIDSSSTIGLFKKLDIPLTIAAGIATLPTDYFQLIGEPWYIDNTDTNDPSATRTIDVVTTLQKAKRRKDYLTQPTAKYPYCEVGSMDASKNIEIRVSPSTITNIYIDYIRLPDTPYLDYYINDTTYIATYLTEGTQNVPIPTGSTYRDGTNPSTVNPITKDWEFTVDSLPLIVAYFRSEIGAILPDDVALQVGEKDKIEINS